MAIFLITTSLIGACAVFNVIDFHQAINERMLINSSDNTITIDATTALPPINTKYITEISPVYLFLCALSLSAISAFLRAGFILKLFMMILTVLLQTFILYTSQLFERYDEIHESL